MQLTRTTIRITPTLKRAAVARALELDVTLQDLFNQALKSYLKKDTQAKIQKMVFHSKAMGVALDDLSREDIYAD